MYNEESIYYGGKYRITSFERDRLNELLNTIHFEGSHSVDISTEDDVIKIDISSKGEHIEHIKLLSRVFEAEIYFVRLIESFSGDYMKASMGNISNGEITWERDLQNLLDELFDGVA